MQFELHAGTRQLSHSVLTAFDVCQPPFKRRNKRVESSLKETKLSSNKRGIRNTEFALSIVTRLKKQSKTEGNEH